MTDMPETLKKKRDERCMKLYGHRWVSNDRKKEGFNLCYKEMAPLIEALELLSNEAESFLSMANKYDHGVTNIDCLERRIAQAREALKKVKGDG